MRKMTRIKLTRMQQAILEGYKAGMTARDIAEQIGTTRGSVAVIAHNLSITRSRREKWRILRGYSVPPEKADDYRLIMKKGFRAREAAEMLGLLPGETAVA
jgi:hypothetical protein